MIDADLGGGVIKQRIARPNAGKSGGFRTIIVLNFGGRAFFVYGFAKSEQHNIRDDELSVFKSLAAELTGYDDIMIARAVGNGTLIEVIRNDEAVSQQNHGRAP